MSDYIVVISGLPRSGTSMIMKMIESGGMEIVTDNVRRPDIDNPEGYYELEKVKEFKKDSTWLRSLHGKAVKIISMLLYRLPSDQNYKVIFVQRDMREILSSQKKMLKRLGEPFDQVPDTTLARKFEIHLAKIADWIKKRKNIECLYVNYRQIVEDPLTNAKRIKDFLQCPLDIEAMASAVDPSLYRNRRS